MKRNGITALTIVFLLLLLTAGGLTLLRPTLADQRRVSAEQEVLARIEAGETELTDIVLPEVEGEETEFFEEEEAGFLAMESDADGAAESGEPERVVGYGTISIPKIELKMALMEGADKRSLRGGAGWLPTSAEMGTAGNCAVFGHRMKKFGRHFNRLDELESGDRIELRDAQGHTYTYVVTGKEVIAPKALTERLGAYTAGFHLTLVTCTPTGVGSHRLLVYAALEQ